MFDRSASPTHRIMVAWRALLGLFVSLALGLVLIRLLPPGAARALVLLLLAALGFGLGIVWQLARERKARILGDLKR
jgi:hypothetical protein